MFERSSSMCSRTGPGEWRVSIVGSQANDRWEMKIVGPNAFERSYTLEGSADEHRPEAIRVILGTRMSQSVRKHDEGYLHKAEMGVQAERYGECSH
jgi:hypothetical protein